MKRHIYDQTHITHFTWVLWNSCFHFSLPYCHQYKGKIVFSGSSFQHILKVQLSRFPCFSPSKTKGLFFMHPAHFFVFHPNKTTSYREEISENPSNLRALHWTGKTSDEWVGAIHCNKEKTKCQSQSHLCSAFQVFLSLYTLSRTAIF